MEILFYKHWKISFNLNITDILYLRFRGYKKNYRNKFKRKDFSFCVELPIKAKMNKLKIGSIGSIERKRIAGLKKLTLLRMGF